MRAIDRLKAALSMEPQRKVVALPKGEELEWWMRPLTLAQRAKAQKLAGGDDATSFALHLLVMVAKDANGEPLFATGELAELRNALPAKKVDEILLAMLQAFKEDGELSFCFFLAEKLHMTVSDLLERMTPEELVLWSGYLGHQAALQDEAQRKAARRR